MKAPQHIIANDEEEFKSLTSKKGVAKLTKQTDNLLGKREIEGLNNYDEADTERDVRERVSATKQRYKQFADILAKEEKLSDYFTQIEKEKHLLVC